MSHREAELELDAAARNALYRAYQLLIQLAAEAADSEEPTRDPQLSTAPDSANRAPSQQKDSRNA